MGTNSPVHFNRGQSRVASIPVKSSVILFIFPFSSFPFSLSISFIPFSLVPPAISPFNPCKSGEFKHESFHLSSSVGPGETQPPNAI